MSYLIQRILIGWLLLVLVLWVATFADSAQAGISDTHGESTEALSHCEANITAAIANRQPAMPPGWTLENGRCTHDAGAKKYNCAIDRYYQGSYNMTMGCNSCFTNSNDCGGSSIFANHYYNTYVDPCEGTEGQQIVHYNDAVYPAYQLPPTIGCIGECEYDLQGIGPDGDLCNYDDANSNGSIDDGETYTCSYYYQGAGVSCSGGSPLNDAPPGGQYDCTNVQCGSDPDPGGGTGTDDGGDSLPGDDPTDPDGDDQDGNPDTPGGPDDGTGDGDVDNDGDRDVDCNPQSNPDCEFTGSGTGSGDCATQPACSGDPVQCAQLYQIWASMCYDGTTLNNPTSCTAALQCDGDKLLCEIIRQQREQYCDLYVGDGTEDLNVFNDANFNRDLKDEAEEIELAQAFDSAGFSGGGSCPAPIEVAWSGGTTSISLQPICDLSGIIQILVVLFATLSGAYIVTQTGRDMA
jgi:hypothetical protein